jgi:hypothetical protein
LIPGGDEVVLYGTIFGTIGALLPIPSRDDLHQMMHIEMYLRKQEPSLVGRDVLSWRSAYTPMKVGLRVKIEDRELLTETCVKLSPHCQVKSRRRFLTPSS